MQPLRSVRRARLACFTCFAHLALLRASVASPKFESVSIKNGRAPIALRLAWQPNTVRQHPVILMLGSLNSNQLPEWSTNLVNEGYMLAAFSADYAPDPVPARRPVWLYFDQRFAHSYVQGAQRAINDSRVVIEYLEKRGNVDPAKIGWIGSSSTGIPGLAVATQGPRLAAVVAVVSTGAYRQWFDTWQPNGLWKGETNSLWPETEDLLARYDPILHADTLFPTALLMVSGGEDKVVDPNTARAFVEAARPFYKSDPDRLRLVVYEGFGHNLPRDIIQNYAEHWFHLYMSPTGAAPRSDRSATNLNQTVIRSQINAADHQKLLGAATGEPPAYEKGQGQRLPASLSSRKKPLEWIKVSSDHRGFVEASTGRKFTPWGFNYDRDYRSRLLEDYWEAEWNTVAEDFQEMKELGANVVRIHLQFAKFMEAPQRPNEKALQLISRLVRLAEETGLYLDLTGLACYRKQDVPAWYDALKEADRWEAQAHFWEAIAAQCAASPAVFCYDLLNEPFVPNDPRAAGDWLAGPLAGFYYLQTITLDPAGRSRTELANAWVTNLVAAVRNQDTNHLITVGLLPNSSKSGAAGSGFDPSAIANALDFVCVHVYPVTGQFKDELANLKTFQIGKPLVMEETFPMYCKPGELREFLDASKSDVCGWMSFYWGQTPAELKQSQKPVDGLLRQWLDVFQKLRPK